MSEITQISEDSSHSLIAVFEPDQNPPCMVIYLAHALDLSNTLLVAISRLIDAHAINPQVSGLVLFAQMK